MVGHDGPVILHSYCCNDQKDDTSNDAVDRRGEPGERDGGICDVCHPFVSDCAIDCVVFVTQFRTAKTCVNTRDLIFPTSDEPFAFLRRLWGSSLTKLASFGYP